MGTGDAATAGGEKWVSEVLSLPVQTPHPIKVTRMTARPMMGASLRPTRDASSWIGTAATDTGICPAWVVTSTNGPFRSVGPGTEGCDSGFSMSWGKVDGSGSSAGEP